MQASGLYQPLKNSRIDATLKTYEFLDEDFSFYFVLIVRCEVKHKIQLKRNK
jgi:hypothetical protein